MRKLIVYILLSLLFINLPAISVGVTDVLSIADPRREPPNTTMGILRPTRTMTMQEVLQQFGAPEKRLKPIGTPPITRWIYQDYTVHFEYNRVIRSVIRRPR